MQSSPIFRQFRGTWQLSELTLQPPDTAGHWDPAPGAHLLGLLGHKPQLPTSKSQKKTH